MSTYFYYRCLSHDPPLESDVEISQHDDVYVRDAIAFAQGKAEWTLERGFLGDWTRFSAIEFLKAHATCAMDVVSEYGEAPPDPGTREVTGELMGAAIVVLLIAAIASILWEIRRRRR